MNASANETLAFTLGGAPFNGAEWYLLLIYVCLAVAFTVGSNGFVIVAVYSYIPLKIEPNYYLASLAVADLAVGLIVMPIAGMYNLMGIWPWGLAMCKFWTFVSYFMTSSSVFHLCAIALDRYNAITNPIGYGAKRTAAQVLSHIAVVLSCSMTVVAPPYLGIYWTNSMPVDNEEFVQCSIHQTFSYTMYSFTLMFMVPAVIIITVYIRLFFITRKRLKRKIERSLNMAKMIEGSTSQERNTVGLTRVPSRAQLMSHMRGFHSAPTSICPTTTAATNSVSRPITRPKCVTYRIIANANREVVSEILEGIPTSVTKDNNMNNSSCPDSDSADFNRVILTLAKGSKRRQQVPATAVVFEETKADELVPCANCNAQIPSTQGILCLVCSAPNNLVFVAEESRVTMLLQRERRALFITGVIILTFLFCFTPAFALYMLLSYDPSYSVNPRLIIMSWWLAYSNSACNPVIYAIFNKDFKDAFNKLVLRRSY